MRRISDIFLGAHTQIHSRPHSVPYKFVWGGRDRIVGAQRKIANWLKLSRKNKKNSFPLVLLVKVFVLHHMFMFNFFSFYLLILLLTLLVYWFSWIFFFSSSSFNRGDPTPIEEIFIYKSWDLPFKIFSILFFYITYIFYWFFVLNNFFKRSKTKKLCQILRCRRKMNLN